MLELHDAIAALPKSAGTRDVQAVERIIRRDFDLDAMARSALADGAPEMAVTSLADALAHDLARRAAADAAADAPVAVVRVKAAGDGVWLVFTHGASAGRANLAWRVRAEPSGPRIVDVLQGGVSFGGRLRRALEHARGERDFAAALRKLSRDPAPADAGSGPG